jgi:hypothetical protein
MLQTEFPFQLPKGLYIDGELHQQGKIKLLTAKDEFIMQDLSNRNPNVDFVFLVLAQAIAKLGNRAQVTPQQLEQLFLPDFLYLQDLFSQLQPQNVATSGES